MCRTTSPERSGRIPLLGREQAPKGLGTASALGLVRLAGLSRLLVLILIRLGLIWVSCVHDALLLGARGWAPIMGNFYACTTVGSAPPVGKIAAPENECVWQYRGPPTRDGGGIWTGTYTTADEGSSQKRTRVSWSSPCR